MRDKFSIVIPVFNECYNLQILIDEIDNTLKHFIYEIIIVDDCSTDETNKLFSNKLHNYKLITHEVNKGQSESIRTGILNSKYENIITIDGDLQNDPKDIPNLIKIFQKEKKNYQLVGGIRKKRKDSFTKILSSIFANSLRKFILKDNCDDTGCGLKIFNKNIFLDFPFFNGIHRFLPALFKGFGHNTCFIEVNHRNRNFGVSKYGTISRLFWGIRDIIKVRKIINKERQ